VPYFHVVFTVPVQIEVIAFQNQTVVYDILFRAASETLRSIAADPEHLGAEIGFLGVLHTWGQALNHHPHLHFLVPGGGIAPDGQSWIACRPGFFLPVQVLSRMFRGLFLRYLEKAFSAGELNFFSEHRHLHESAMFRRYLTPAWRAEWVVYAKRPFAGPAQVLDYVGRYTHRVAISNNRLVSMDDGKVCFRWKDYRDDNHRKTMTLPAEEFIRRFLIHVLPDGFHRIRYFGFLGNCHRARKLALCRELLGMAPTEPAADAPADYRDRVEALTGQSVRECPHYRHHGGDRLHRGIENLSAGSGYMTPNRRSNRTKPNRPPGRSVDAHAATATDVGERRLSGQITAVTIARRLVWCGGCLPIALRDVPRGHRRRMPRHSIPIARAAGGAV
jgi:Putative transposase